ncbi:hypothetical protein JCM11491_002502 [Sporobolomyces phaffii]
MLPLLPTELLRHVFDSSVTHTFHRDTYYKRQATLRSLCLVSRRFRDIARPLLHEIVWIRSTQCKERFDRSKTTSGSDATRWLVIGDREPHHWHDEQQKEIFGNVVREFPAITRLIANAAVALDTLPSSLTHLQIPRRLPPASTPISLPNIRSLSLYLELDDSPRVILDILDLFPNLRALALQHFCESLHLVLHLHRFQSLFVRLEMLKINTYVWTWTHRGFREAASSRTIVECQPEWLSGILDPACKVQHVSIRDVQMRPSSPDFVPRALLEFPERIRSTPSLTLRTIYLDPSLLHDPIPYPPLAKAIDELVVVCKERGIDLVADGSNSLQLVNPSIPEEYL